MARRCLTPAGPPSPMRQTCRHLPAEKGVPVKPAVMMHHDRPGRRKVTRSRSHEHGRRGGVVNDRRGSSLGGGSFFRRGYLGGGLSRLFGGGFLGGRFGRHEERGRLGTGCPETIHLLAGHTRKFTGGRNEDGYMQSVKAIVLKKKIPCPAGKLAAHKTRVL
jgi:hypothetical protein